MRPILAALVVVLAAAAARGQGRLADPVTLFADLYVPTMKAFEKTEIQTTLRGFIMRGDTQRQIEAMVRTGADNPSRSGISLNVGVAEADRKAFDETKQNGDYQTRTIQIPADAPEEQSLWIVFSYGAEAPAKIVEAIQARCDELKRSAGPAAAETPDAAR